jgi:hypothetical protein
MMTTDTSRRVLFQFRSSLLERRIVEYAGLWNLTPNEAAKRLTSLAANRLDIDQYPRLLSLSETFCSPRSSKVNFAKACHEVRNALDAANQARKDMGLEPLNGEEREQFIQRTIEEMTNKREAKSRDSE